MATLQKTNIKNVYRINSPAHCGALTRSGGRASNALLNRINHALGGDVQAMDIKQGLTTNSWFIQVNV